VALRPAQSPAQSPGLSLIEDASGVDILLGSIPVGRYVARSTTDAFESPRPYLHPLRTAAGVELTDFRPPDHVWHHGLALGIPSVGAPSVGASNLWGGRSWDGVAGEYLEKNDNGSMRTEEVAVDSTSGRIRSRVVWLGADGSELAEEERTLRLAEAVDDGDGWTIEWTSRIRSLTDLHLGSPATYGRTGAGYGGLFLRAAPAFRGARARTDRSDRVPADDLLGTPARWLAMTRPDGAATIVLGTPQDATWFVRSEEYPGFGPAPFFGDEVVLAAGEHLDVAVRVWAVDGEPSVDSIERVFAAA
jgi:methane monooxygenase PmoA-like